MSSLYRILSVTLRIFRGPHRAQGFALLYNYLKICTLSNGATEARVLGSKLRFVNKETLRYLFEEIFVDATYYFQAKSLTPQILDAGSNMGLAACYFKWLYPRARIQCFEPDPTLFEILEQNVTQNQWPQIQLHRVAVSSHEGILKFSSSRESSLVGRLSLDGMTQVQARPLSQFITGPVDFLKMDIEGAEADSVEELNQTGALNQILEFRIECHVRADSPEALPRVLEALQATGKHFTLQPGSPSQSGEYDVLVKGTSSDGGSPSNAQH